MAIQSPYNEREASNTPDLDKDTIARMLWNNQINNNTSSTVDQGGINLVTQNDRNDDNDE